MRRFDGQLNSYLHEGPTASIGNVWPLQPASPMPPRVGSPGASSPQDPDWHDIFDVQVERNPEPSSSQREAVAREHDRPRGHVSLYVCGTFLCNLKKRLHLDFEHDAAMEKSVMIAKRNRANMALATANGHSREFEL